MILFKNLEQNIKLSIFAPDHLNIILIIHFLDYNKQMELIL